MNAEQSWLPLALHRAILQDVVAFISVTLLKLMRPVLCSGTKLQWLEASFGHPWHAQRPRCRSARCMKPDMCEAVPAWTPGYNASPGSFGHRSSAPQHPACTCRLGNPTAAGNCSHWPHPAHGGELLHVRMPKAGMVFPFVMAASPRQWDELQPPCLRLLGHWWLLVLPLSWSVWSVFASGYVYMCLCLQKSHLDVTRGGLAPTVPLTESEWFQDDLQEGKGCAIQSWVMVEGTVWAVLPGEC